MLGVYKRVKLYQTCGTPWTRSRPKSNRQAHDCPPADWFRGPSAGTLRSEFLSFPSVPDLTWPGFEFQSSCRFGGELRKTCSMAHLYLHLHLHLRLPVTPGFLLDQMHAIKWYWMDPEGSGLPVPVCFIFAITYLHCVTTLLSVYTYCPVRHYLTAFEACGTRHCQVFRTVRSLLPITVHSIHDGRNLLATS